eukprot:13018455-Ditylum_brightwellii.AAC.1
MQKWFYTLKQESRLTRSTLLEEQGKELERAGKGKEATIIHNKLKNEKQCEHNQRLQRITNDEKKERVCSVQVEQQAIDSEGRGIVDERGSPIMTQVDIHGKNQVESACMTEVAQRSRMAEYSSPMTAWLVNYLEYSGTTVAADRIFAGDIPKVEGIDLYTEAYLQQLQTVENQLPAQSHPVDFARYQKEVKDLGEQTSSGPSMVTPGMIKTELEDKYISQ